ncbi:uncharacterized protein LOC125625882 [Caretta caretta]|uniref:uncharacterized protein LOC125625882 n=1 Tax=Caretta caretta TaxID=8467 RepID=UPI003D42CF4A
MKLFTLILTLAILAGSQASLLSDEPTPRLEQVRKGFWEYVAKATSSTEKTMELIRKSELGQEINSCISHSLAAANTYGTELQKQLPLEAQELAAKPSKGTEQLVQKIAGELQQKGQWSVEDLQAGPAPYAEGLLEQAEQRAETLHHSVAAGTQELSERLQQSVEKLRSQLGPFAQELSERLQQPVQEFQQGLEPYLQKLQGSLSHDMQHVRRNLHPYAEDLQGRLGSLWASFLQHFQ